MKQGTLLAPSVARRLVVLSLTLVSALWVTVVGAGMPAAVGDPVLIVSGDRQEESVDRALRAVEVAAGLPLGAVPVAELRWQTLANFGFRPGFADTVWWVRLDLQNVDPSPHKRYLRIEQPTLEDVQFRMRCDNGYGDDAVGGDSRPLSRHRLPDRNPAFDFTVPAGTHCLLLFRVAGLQTLQFPAVIADPLSYGKRQQRDSIVRGIGFGMQGLFLLLALAGAALLHSRITARLALLVAVQSAALFVFSGLGFQFLWGEMPDLQHALAGMATSICWTMTALYCLRALSPELTRGLPYLLTAATCMLSLGASLINLVMPQPALQALIVASTALGLLLLLAITGSAVALRIHHSGYAALGVVVLASGALLDTLGYLGLLSLGTWFLLPTQLAFLLQTALFALAQLSPAVHVEASDTPHQRPQSKGDIEREVTRRVAERTRELSQTVAQLTSSNRQLDYMSSTDSLTGTWNRRHMDHYLAQSAEEVRSVHSALSIILFDIDHFKEVNDRHGHRAGDRCLRLVADCVQQQLRDESDILCRYGGEEFAVILPHTDQEGASAVAEKIRLAVEKAELQCTPETGLHLTISLGVATQDAGAAIDLEELVNNADRALYRAKQTGRNRWLAATA